MRVPVEEYAALDLRAQALLADAPLHDVWAVDLPGGGPGRTILDLRAVMEGARVTSANGAVRLLFGLRARLGRAFGWDREPAQAPAESYLHRLTAADREGSLVPPGTREGAFRVLYASPREAVSEIHNATVHAFSVFALREQASGYRLYWAVHVRPVGRITAWYMRLIDPFRRGVIYPAVLRRVRDAWERGLARR